MEKNSTCSFANLELKFSTYINYESKQQSAVPVTVPYRNQHFYGTLLLLQFTPGIEELSVKGQVATLLATDN